MKHWQDCALPDRNLFPEQYSVLEVLRENNAGSVLLGFDQNEDSKVIIKCFKQGAKSTYLREISAVYDLKHKHLARCLNTFHRTDGSSCLVYEYVSGGNLADLLETSKVLDIGLIFNCLHDILNVLIYLHALNRIHCDIKPENIFLRPKPDGQFEFVLGDLGAACFIREAREGQHVIGTPAYIAPERIRNQFFFNSDLYSLGVVAFELSTGYRPFMGTVEEITQANLTQIPSLEAIKYQPLRDLIDHFLTKSPQKRIETASLAYFYLNKLQRQYEVSLSNQKNGQLHQQDKSGSSISKTQKLPKLKQLNLEVDDNLQAIHCFLNFDRMLIGLSYTGYTDIIDPKFPAEVIKTITHTHSIQVTETGAVIYATPTCLNLLDLKCLHSKTLIEQTNSPKNFHFYNNRLLFTDDFNVFFYDLNNSANISFRSISYLFDSKMCLFEDGTFCMSEGIANDTVVMRSIEGSFLFKWILDGPLVAMTRIDDKIICITLSVKDQNSYSIWCLQGTEEAKKCVTSHKIKQISCAENAIYWLTQEAELYCCGADLQPKMIGQFTQNAVKFAVSFDGQYIVVLDLIERNQAIVTFFNNREL
jgi:serine/threonine protein kinase